jgi:phosphoglycolate phosphatase-like HAD superfamily hydrolase
VGDIPQLLLFDIDGTLVSGAAEAHAQALHEALRLAHGVEARGMPAPIAPAGRTDPEIARGLLLRLGVSAAQIDDRADAVREECCRAYARLCPADLSHTVLPGIPSLLSWLASQPGARLGLLTGNYEPVARLKLRRAGLGGHFPGGQGAFGSDSEDRTALPAIARRRAGTVGSPHPRERTVVIGDTPRDIACARVDGVRCVAVATGPFEAGALAEADAVVSGADELRRVLAGWL